MFATDKTVGLAEWIIDDTCLIYSIFRRPGSPSQQGNRLPASYQSLHESHNFRNHVTDEEASRSSSNSSHKEPRRAFDVSSLIGETSKTPPPPPMSTSPPGTSLEHHQQSYPSPNVSVGPPPPPPVHPAPPPGLYPYLLHSGLYQQLAAQAAAAGGGQPSSPVPPFNPMLLNAHLALNPFLASAAYAANLSSLAASERLRNSNRFSPYSPTSPRTSSVSPVMSGSAFHPIGSKLGSPLSSPIKAESERSMSPAKSPVKSVGSREASVSPPMCGNNGVTSAVSSSVAETTAASNNDLKGMEKLINGLNGDIKSTS